jgi:hypothetical protein
LRDAAAMVASALRLRAWRAHYLARFALSLAMPSLLSGCDTVGVKDAYTALDAAGNRKRSTFYTEAESIYCVMELASGIDDYSVTAKIRARSLFEDVRGRPRPLSGRAIIGAEEQLPGRGENLKASFQLLRPEGDEFYPAGEFVCELYIDNELERALPFKILYPDCPFAPIKAGSACGGLVLRGASCPSPLGGTCVCNEETSVWDCE